MLYMLALAVLTVINTQAYAQEEGSSTPSYAYIALEPDIVANYVGDNSKRLGYLRVTVEVMLHEPDFIPDIEHHMPLLRATAIEIIGAQPEQKVKSLTGREEIRRAMAKRFKDLMLRETGDEIIKDVIFTAFLRQGG
ncbi:flagellar basal body-associated protein FliL [Agaribacter marinus]|uniref:Flagellar protein FliL n=1 Tax=Agaribacter marinus TaxID=1431249 RepID=A0AA37WGU9_9ALTE|nr:flagellar basal body-associated protein FliL [Agaribacter marinus]